jgi:hypothetical protein
VEARTKSERSRKEGALAVWVAVLVTLCGASLVLLVIGVAKLFIGTDSGDPSQWSPQAVTAAPAVPAVAQGGAQGKSLEAKKSRDAKKSRKAKKPDKKSATPAAAVSEPSFAPAPTTKKRGPAPIQPASEPVAPAPPPSGGGVSNAPPKAQNDPPQLAEHGIGGGEAWHGIAPGGG